MNVLHSSELLVALHSEENMDGFPELSTRRGLGSKQGVAENQGHNNGLLIAARMLPASQPMVVIRIEWENNIMASS